MQSRRFSMQWASLRHDVHRFFEQTVRGKKRTKTSVCNKPRRRFVHSADHGYISETGELWTNTKSRSRQLYRVCVSEESHEKELKLEMSEMYDCIVIGAGIQGSCTAYQLAKNKQKTLLLEQVGYSMICRLIMIYSLHSKWQNKC